MAGVAGGRGAPAQLHRRERGTGVPGAGPAPGELLARKRLRRLHVGLIEGVHVQLVAQLPGSELPFQELRTEIERVFREFRDDLGVRAPLRCRVVDQRYHAPSRLPGALRHELLHPCGDRRHARRWTEHELVAPGEGGASQRHAPGLGARDVHREGPLQQRSEEHTSELQSRPHLVCRLLLEKKKKKKKIKACENIVFLFMEESRMNGMSGCRCSQLMYSSRRAMWFVRDTTV